MPKEMESHIDLQPVRFSMDRRRFIAATGTLVGGTALGVTTGAAPALAAKVISGHKSFEHLNIGPNEVVVFNPNKDTTVHAHMVHVEGVLRMRPAKPGVKHRLIIGEGLHVEGGGRLDIVGTKKKAWTRARSGLKSGQRRIKVTSVDGWRAGDRVVITPTGSPRNPSFDNAYDSGRIRRIDRRRKIITLSSPLRRDHPRVNVGVMPGERKARRYGAEVLNMSRNVQIDGSGDVHIHNTRRAKHRVNYANISGLGVRDELGRYPLHFHTCRNNAAGSIVRGTVVENSANHGFVAHSSNRITFSDCIAHNIRDSAFWWDRQDESGDKESNFVTYRRCVASDVDFDETPQAFKIMGFFLAAGRDRSNSCIGCVAVGIKGQDNANGFGWDADAQSVWNFRDCLAHNNRRNGIWVWQNTSRIHRISKTVCYHNGDVGIDHGSYANNYHYDGIICHGNKNAQVLVLASSRGRQTFRNVLMDGTGLSEFAMIVSTGVPTPDAVDDNLFTTIENCVFRNYRRKGVQMTEAHENTQ
ncbi:MAG TPA: right-handed parallel beta-helix repeat-containing protein, partial [Actinomycetota bacterium]|nr:right-handed parallel beta-helix repeat-containing protein [Actinomycetota bacterium]